MNLYGPSQIHFFYTLRSRFIFLVLLSLVVLKASLAQNVSLFDSLHVKLKQTHDPLEKAKLNNLICEYYNNQGSSDSGLRYAHSAVRILTSIKNKDSAEMHEFIMAHNNRLNCISANSSNSINTKTDSIIKALLQEYFRYLALANEHNLRIARVECLNNIGNRYTELGRPGKCKTLFPDGHF